MKIPISSKFIFESFQNLLVVIKSSFLSNIMSDLFPLLIFHRNWLAEHLQNLSVILIGRWGCFGNIWEWKNHRLLYEVVYDGKNTQFSFSFCLSLDWFIFELQNVSCGKPLGCVVQIINIHPFVNCWKHIIHWDECPLSGGFISVLCSSK